MECGIYKLLVVVGRRIPAPPSVSMCRYFQTNVRSFNNAFSLASFQTFTAEYERKFSNGPPFVVVNGRAYAATGPLHAASEEQARFASVYFQPAAADLRALTIRQHQSSDSRAIEEDIVKRVVENLTDELKGGNQLVRTYEFAYDLLREAKNGAEQVVVILSEPSLQVAGHRGRYEMPSDPQSVAVLYDDASCAETEAKHGIVCSLRGFAGRSVRRLSILHRSYCDLLYILLFPRGRGGWHRDLSKTNGKKLTLREFEACRIFYRDSSGLLFRGKRLFAQYLCDSYLRVEKSRLAFIRRNQEKVLGRQAGGVNTNSVMLPRTFVGSNKYMRAKALNAIAAMRRRGK